MSFGIHGLTGVAGFIVLRAYFVLELSFMACMG